MICTFVNVAEGDRCSEPCAIRAHRCPKHTLVYCVAYVNDPHRVLYMLSDMNQAIAAIAMVAVVDDEDGIMGVYRTSMGCNYGRTSVRINFTPSLGDRGGGRTTPREKEKKTREVAWITRGDVPSRWFQDAPSMLEDRDGGSIVDAYIAAGCGDTVLPESSSSDESDESDDCGVARP